MIIKRLTKAKNLSEERAFKIAKEEAEINPSLDAIFIDQRTVSDLLIHEFGRIRRCTPEEWARFIKESL
jgi:hypothetical protein